jgi:prevent-host-death family protein
MLDITKDIQSLTNFRRKSRELLEEMKKSKRPVVLTVNGKAEAVVQDAESYQRLLDIAARADVYEAVRQGVGTISSTDGRVRPARCSTSCAGAMAYLVELTRRAERDLDYLLAANLGRRFGGGWPLVQRARGAHLYP